MGLGFVVGIVGGFLLAHAAFSTIQYRGELKIMEEQFTGPPFNVVIELLVGLVLCLWAGLAVPTKFLSILPDSDENRRYLRVLSGYVLDGLCRSTADESKSTMLTTVDVIPASLFRYQK